MTGDELAAGSSLCAAAIAGEVRMIALSAVSVASMETADTVLHKRPILRLRTLVMVLNLFHAVDVELTDLKHSLRQGIVRFEYTYLGLAAMPHNTPTRSAKISDSCMVTKYDL